MELENILMRYFKKKKVGLALGSGGAKGIAHIGVLEVLEEYDITISEISGCSIGAIIGALYAAGVSIEKMKEISFKIDLKKLWNFFDFTNPISGGLVRGNAVEDFLSDILPVQRFEELRIPFKCIATDIKSGEPVIFDSGDLIPAIRASISIPGLFIPYKYEDRLLVDGAVINPVPTHLLSSSKFKIAVIVYEYQTMKKLSKRKITLDNLIKKHLSNRFDPIIDRIIKNKKPKKEMNFLNILSSSIDNISKNVIESDMKGNDADLIIKPDVKDIATLAFHESFKSYIAGVDAAELKIQSLKYDENINLK